MKVNPETFQVLVCPKCGDERRCNRVTELPGRATSGWQCRTCGSVIPDKILEEQWCGRICNALSIPEPTTALHRRFLVSAWETGECVTYCHDRPIMVPVKGDLSYWKMKFNGEVRLAVFSGANYWRHVIYPASPESESFKAALNRMFGLADTP